VPHLLAICRPLAAPEQIRDDFAALGATRLRFEGLRVTALVRRPMDSAWQLANLVDIALRTFGGCPVSVGVNVGRHDPEALDEALERAGVDKAELRWLQVPEGADLAAWGAFRAASCPAATLSSSIHDPADIPGRLALGANALLLSPVYATTSKPGLPPLAPGVLRAACLRAPGTVHALGGVTADRVAALVGAGAAGVAAISAVWQDGGVALAAALASLHSR
jgi:hypothetical protein